MRLQALGVVFAMIIVPLIMVLSYYLNLQIKTIAKQNDYDISLLSATYDAMSSFELNTANEDLSSVSDALRTIIEASSNVFINTLSTNLGVSNASKSYIEPFVPALLYTLYDGYYIYSPTKVPKMFADPKTGTAVAIGDVGLLYDTSGFFKYYSVPTAEELATDPGSYSSYDSNDYIVKIDDLNDELKQYYGQQLFVAKPRESFESGSDLYIHYDEYCKPLKHFESINTAASTTIDYVTPNAEYAKVDGKSVLKSYMPYSAKYVQDDINVTVVYTLDNFVSVEGTINGIYYAKSGYLIPIDNSKVELTFTIHKGEETLGDAAPEDTDYIINCNQSAASEYIRSGHTVDLTIKNHIDGNSITISSGNREVIDNNSDGVPEEVHLYLYKDPEKNQLYNSYSDLLTRKENLTERYYEAKNYYLSLNGTTPNLNDLQTFFTDYKVEGLEELPADTFDFSINPDDKRAKIKEKLYKFMNGSDNPAEFQRII